MLIGDRLGVTMIASCIIPTEFHSRERGKESKRVGRNWGGGDEEGALDRSFGDSISSHLKP